MMWRTLTQNLLRAGPASKSALLQSCRRTSAICLKRHFETHTEEDGGDKIPLYDGHIPTSFVQKSILGVGSSLAALLDPWRADMVAVNGEVTGHLALQSMYQRMMDNPEGRNVLRERPRISTQTVDFEALRNLPPNTLGYSYAAYNDYYSISPDTRSPVHFVDDPDLAYVIQRYREIHDLVHTVLDMPTNMVGEVAVKWVEGLQNGLPMCIGGAIFGPMRFTPKQVRQFRHIRPWVVKVGTESEFFMNVHYEQRWEQDIEEFREEMNVPTPPKLLK